MRKVENVNKKNALKTFFGGLETLKSAASMIADEINYYIPLSENLHLFI